MGHTSEPAHPGGPANCHAKQPAHGEEGQAVVELAVMVAILLILSTGMMNFGMAMKNDAALTDGVNVATRQLAISRGQTTDPCATVTSALISATPNLDSTKMAFTTTINSGLSSYVYTGTTCSGPNTYSGAPGYLRFQGTVRFTVTYPCFLALYGKSNITGCTLTASTLEVVQ